MYVYEYIAAREVVTFSATKSKPVRTDACDSEGCNVQCYEVKNRWHLTAPKLHKIKGGMLDFFFRGSLWGYAACEEHHNNSKILSINVTEANASIS